MVATRIMVHTIVVSFGIPSQFCRIHEDSEPGYVVKHTRTFIYFFKSLLNTSAILGSIMALLGLCLRVYLNVGLLGHTYSN